MGFIGPPASIYSWPHGIGPRRPPCGSRRPGSRSRSQSSCVRPHQDADSPLAPLVGRRVDEAHLTQPTLHGSNPGFFGTTKQVSVSPSAVLCANSPPPRSPTLLFRNSFPYAAPLSLFPRTSPCTHTGRCRHLGTQAARHTCVFLCVAPALPGPTRRARFSSRLMCRRLSTLSPAK